MVKKGRKNGNVMFVRLSDGLAGKMQAIKYHRMFKAQIQFRGDKYIAAIDVSNKDTLEAASNYTDYLFGRRRISEKVH